MKFKFTGTISIDITGIEVDAKDEDEARDIIARMSEEDLLSEGVVDSSYFKGVSFEVAEADYKVFINRIDYDIREMDLPEKVLDDLMRQADGLAGEYDYLVKSKIQNIKEGLPTDFTVIFKSIKPGDVERYAEDYVASTTGYNVFGVEVQILETL